MAHARKPGQHVNYPPNIYDIRGTGNIGGIANWAIIIHRIPKKQAVTEFAEEVYTPYFSFKIAKNRINGRIYTFYGEYINNQVNIVQPHLVEEATKVPGGSVSEKLNKTKLSIAKLPLEEVQQTSW
jgi:hypothetical protein